MDSRIAQFLEESETFIATPHGTSMWPLLRHCRDTIYIHKFEGTLKKHDIVLYKRDSGENVLHRCLSIDPDGTYTMCGDHQCFLEHGVRKDQIMGYALGIYRDEKYIPCTNPIYRLYVALWCSSLRLRGYMLRILNRVFDLNKVLNYPKAENGK